MKRLLLPILLLFGALHVNSQCPEQDLAGVWRFQLDPMGFGKTPGSELYQAKLVETILLPGTTDEAGKGVPVAARHVDRLTRKFEYCGQAWYQREVSIPDDWAGRNITLHLERCHWETTVYVDGVLVGSQEHLSVPNRFDLSSHLTPGVHTLTVCVDNRLKYPMDQWNHGTTEHTQTNWNGMVGKLRLEARPANRIVGLQAHPNIARRAVCLNVKLSGTGKARQTAKLKLTLLDEAGHIVAQKTSGVHIDSTSRTLTDTLVFGREMKLWNEFTPYLYSIKAELASEAGTDTLIRTFGMREVSQGRHHVRINGRNVHLRGTLDCCVFPLTGYPPTDAGEWQRIFRIVKSYGFNHVRFHSWCPPEAAFEAADRVGLYLQAELPMWIKDVGKHPARRQFFENEMYAILEEYGNHPSFILMCNGNENEGDFAVLEDLVKKGRAFDARRLYSASTARTHTASDQYYVSHVTSKGWITVYEGRPGTDYDRSEASGIDCPVIAHETGQRCMYPNFKEQAKYTGVLQPRNFEVFRERLARNGMLPQADDFFKATGAHTVLQYKEVNEALLRTANSGGFQLLGLTDFPGQGSAFVGLLDAFYDSKELVTPAKYRESCAPTVLLARLPKRTFTTDETFSAKMEIYHYGEQPVKRGHLKWELCGEDGKVVAQGREATPAIACDTVCPLSGVSINLASLGLGKAGKLTFRAMLGNYRNEWDIWVYPPVSAPSAEGYLYATAYTPEVRTALERGERVLLVPQKAPGRKTHFAGHFWNPVMFNWSPMIVGTLIDARHPAFADFPTDSYADWQWWDILNHATAMELNETGALTPVIQSIDTYENNRKLGIAYEAKVGKGRLFVLCVDFNADIERRPAARALLRSVCAYVASERFRPHAELPLHRLDALFLDAPAASEGAQKAKAGGAVRQLLNQ